MITVQLQLSYIVLDIVTYNVHTYYILLQQ